MQAIAMSKDPSTGGTSDQQRMRLSSQANLRGGGRFDLIERLLHIPKIGKHFLAVVVVQFIFMMTIRVLKYENNAEESKYYNEPEQLWILLFVIIMLVFMLYFSFNAILNENVIELASFMIATLLLVARTAFEFGLKSVYCPKEGAVKGYNGEEACTGVLVITLLFEVVYLSLVMFVKRSFGWRFFKSHGGDMQLRALLMTYEVFFSLLKFDIMMMLLFFFTSYMFVPVTELRVLNIVLLCIMAIDHVGLVQMIRREVKKPVLILLAWQIAQVGLIVATLVVARNGYTHNGHLGYGIIHRTKYAELQKNPACKSFIETMHLARVKKDSDWSTFLKDSSTNGCDKYLTGAVSSFLFIGIGSAAILVRVFLCTWTIKALKNFRKGLDRVYKAQQSAEAGAQFGMDSSFSGRDTLYG